MEFLDYYSNEMQKRLDDGMDLSRAFIAVYINLFYRLDYGDERDFICDKANDRGIDAIYINDEVEEVYFIQSKFGDSNNTNNFQSVRKIGEKEPSHFIGSVEKFKTKEGIQTILDSPKTSQELKDLIIELNLLEKTNFDFKMIFITNGEHNQDSLDVENSTDINFILLPDFEEEYKRYISVINATNPEPIDFEFFPIENMIIDSSFDSKICLMKAKDLVKINGILDYSVFAENVRGWLGRNRVFKAITNNLKDDEYDQSKNILYHNGITIICSQIEYKKNKLYLKDLSIVNGCQSTYAFYINRDKLKNKNHVLVKIIPLKDNPTIEKKNIVHFSNNQIAVKASDLVSLSANSVYIQNIFQQNDKEWCVKIKDGQDNIDCTDKRIIKLAQLAQYVASLYNVGHIRAANKNKLIETSYYEIFKGIEYEHMKIAIILSDLFDKAISELKEDQTEDQERLLSTYHLTKLFFLTCIKEIYLEVHKIKTIDLINLLALLEIEDNQKIYITNYKNMIIDLTFELKQTGELLDYRTMLKSKEKSDVLMALIIKEYQKNITKEKGNTFLKIT